MAEFPDIKHLDVETPLGVVHLAAFTKRRRIPEADPFEKIPSHRDVIFEILSDFCGSSVTASDLVQTDENPRPCFPRLDIDANWTHSGELCILAYTRSREIRVGVDLEVHSPKRLPVAERFYEVQEVERLRQLSATQSDSAVAEFFRLWCRKEALYKCVGGNFFSDALGRCVLDNPLQSAANHQVHFVDLDADAICKLGPLFQDEKKDADSSASLCIAVARWPQ